MGKLKIYLDNCCYGRPFDNQDDAEIQNDTQAKMSIQSLVKSKAIELAYSSISVEEISEYPFEENRNAILRFIEDNATYYVDNDNDETAITITEEIMKTGVRLKDASHVACAIIAKCDFFVTTDKRLVKHQDSRVRILNPISFLEIWRDSNV
jgi:predicted nucleic acid-binding protein